MVKIEANHRYFIPRRVWGEPAYHELARVRIGDAQTCLANYNRTPSYPRHEGKAPIESVVLLGRTAAGGYDENISRFKAWCALGPWLSPISTVRQRRVLPDERHS